MYPDVSLLKAGAHFNICGHRDPLPDYKRILGMSSCAIFLGFFIHKPKNMSCSFAYTHYKWVWTGRHCISTLHRGGVKISSFFLCLLPSILSLCDSNGKRKCYHNVALSLLTRENRAGKYYMAKQLQLAQNLCRLERGDTACCQIKTLHPILSILIALITYSGQ